MSVRGFYRTVDRDEIPITFDYPEEKRAFETGLNKISGYASRLRQYEQSLSGKNFEPPVPGKPFLTVDDFEYSADKQGRLFATRANAEPLFTTLEKEQVSKYMDIICRIYGLNVCNVHSRKNMNMCIYTDYKWREDKWIPRV